ncbi:MAG: glycoside hydrolase family 15 protein [Verrucomicrobiota bacterium]
MRTSTPIEDYGLVGNLRTAALVSRTGSVDWLCLPRFDSAACFAALLGTSEHGRWLIAPKAEPRRVERRYRPDTLVLETTFETDEGAARVVDFMPPGRDDTVLVRLVEGLEGCVEIETELVLRFEYGSAVPWLRRMDDARLAVVGPNAVRIESGIELEGKDFTSVGSATVSAGESLPFALTWFASHGDLPPPVDAGRALEETEAFWQEWSGRCAYSGEWAEPVRTSLRVLKALIYEPTGGIVAAPTTSLPEWIGGPRNWDYRYCWIRDATLTLVALIDAGYLDEARGWREWLFRAAAGRPADLQIMYGVAGERRLAEYEADWLPGYEGSTPVRIGNAASEQVQLDVYGEIIDAFTTARTHGLEPSDHAWELSVNLLEFLDAAWRRPDSGLWEVRGPSRHFTHSKVMAWVAFDRAIRTCEEWGREGPVDRWRSIRDEIHADVCANGFEPELGSFVQSYGSRRLDASLLLIPLVGFLPAEDERVVGTVDAIGRVLSRDGLIARYEADEENGHVDGLPSGEGVFLPCSFWYAADLALLGRAEEARALFTRLLSLRNDLGLISEEYDPEAGRMLGNFPQAFTHLALVGCAYLLERGGSPRGTRAG